MWKMSLMQQISKLAHPDLHFLFPIAGKVDKDEERSRVYADWRAFVQESPSEVPMTGVLFWVRK